MRGHGGSWSLGQGFERHRVCVSPGRMFGGHEIRVLEGGGLEMKFMSLERGHLGAWGSYSLWKELWGRHGIQESLSGKVEDTWWVGIIGLRQ